MQPQTPEISDEITFFVTEGMHRLANISTNDYGYLLSARMAQTYLIRAVQVLESKRGFDREFLTEISRLKVSAGAIALEYAKFETFCIDCDRFSCVETKNWTEWISKWAVRAISRGYRGTVSHHLAHKICTFHSRVCSILMET